jgi:hypothetical protein
VAQELVAASLVQQRHLANAQAKQQQQQQWIERGSFTFVVAGC